MWVVVFELELQSYCSSSASLLPESEPSCAVRGAICHGVLLGPFMLLKYAVEMEWCLHFAWTSQSTDYTHLQWIPLESGLMHITHILFTDSTTLPYLWRSLSNPTAPPYRLLHFFLWDCPWHITWTSVNLHASVFWILMNKTKGRNIIFRSICICSAFCTHSNSVH